MPDQQSSRPSTPPKTLAEDLRGRTDEQLAALLRARPDLVNPVPSDMRALTTRAATSPSIARYLDTVDCVHHFALAVAGEQSTAEPTTDERIVEAVAQAVGDETIRPYAAEAVAQLRSAALLWGAADRTHVVTAVRDQVIGAPVPSWPPPSCGGEPVDHDDDQATTALRTRAGAQAHSVIATIEEVGDLWSLDPGPVLRSGGLSARALDALSEQLQVPDASLATALDTARSAGLIAQGSTGKDIGWMPTEAFRAWCAEPAAKRWAAIARAWLQRPATTTSKPLTDDEHAFVSTWRRQLLATLADASCACDLPTAIAIVDFRWPRRRGSKREEVLTATWREAEQLGLLVDGVLAPAGRLLAGDAGSASVAKAIAPDLTGEVDKVHVQADHTIVAPGPLEPGAGRRLREIADVESRGHATVFRLTGASLKRALALDPDPRSWTDFLTSISSKPLPQPVAYLISEAARSTPAARSRFTAPAEPTPVRRVRVEASPARIDKALDVLRARKERQVSEIVPEIAEDASALPTMESAAVVAALRYAIDHHETVRIAHAESDGSVASLLVDPIRLGGGSLTAYDHHAEQVRTFAVSRISAVVSVRISA